MFKTANHISETRFTGRFQDRWFKLGFGVGIGVFVLLNYLSFIIAYAEYTAPKEVIFSAGGYFAGFPFRAYHEYYGYPSGADVLIFGLAADLLIAFLGAFLLGLLFRRVHSMITLKNIR